jgi:hypothetical protein
MTVGAPALVAELSRWLDCFSQNHDSGHLQHGSVKQTQMTTPLGAARPLLRRAQISPTLGEHRGQLLASGSSPVTSVFAGFRSLPRNSGDSAFDYGSIGRGFKSLRAHQIKQV